MLYIDYSLITGVDLDKGFFCPVSKFAKKATFSSGNSNVNSVYFRTMAILLLASEQGSYILDSSAKICAIDTINFKKCC